MSAHRRNGCASCKGDCSTPDACRLAERSEEQPDPIQWHDLVAAVLLVLVCIGIGTGYLGTATSTTLAASK